MTFGSATSVISLRIAGGLSSGRPGGHDEPPDLPASLLAAGFVPVERETVVIGLAEQMAVEPMLPDGVRLRQVHEPSDFARTAAMESEV